MSSEMNRYVSDRQEFLAAVHQASCSAYAEYRHPLNGPGGEALFTGAFYFGEVGENRKPVAKRCLVIGSGTHGIEGKAGSFVQTQLLSRRDFLRTLGKDTGLLMIHAINSWGYAWGRRVDHKNIDVNRNAGTEFVTRCDFASLINVLMPKEWNEESERRLQDSFNDPVFGSRVKDAATGGQYDFPEAIFYGGCAPSWSIRTLEDIVRTWLSEMRAVVFLDIHTGLGEYAVGELLSTATSLSDPEAIRLRSWFGLDVAFPNTARGESVSSAVSGDILSALGRWLPGTEVTPVGLEMGTGVPVPVSLPMLVRENALHHECLVKGAPLDGPETAESFSYRLYVARNDLWEVFSRPNDEFWKGALLNRSLQTVNTMLKGLKL